MHNFKMTVQVCLCNKSNAVFTVWAAHTCSSRWLQHEHLTITILWYLHPNPNSNPNTKLNPTNPNHNSKTTKTQRYSTSAQHSHSFNTTVTSSTWQLVGSDDWLYCCKPPAFVTWQQCLPVLYTLSKCKYICCFNNERGYTQG